jgi:hypothetical protein
MNPQSLIRVVAVGVNDFQDPAFGALDFPGSDAAGLARLLAGSRKLGTVLSEQTGRRNRQLRPTHTNILVTLDRLKDESCDEDIIIFACFTHALDIGGVTYLFPCDGLKDHPDATAIAIPKLKEHLDSCKARIKVLVLDVCREIHEPRSVRGAHTSFQSAPALLRGAPLAKGWAILYGCSQGEQSHEDPRLGHGVYLKFLLEGLSGAAQGNVPGWISLINAHEYADQKTVDWALANGRVQHPELACQIAGGIPVVQRRSA